MALKLATYGHVPARFRRTLSTFGELVDLSSLAARSDNGYYDALILGDCDEGAILGSDRYRFSQLCLYGTQYGGDLLRSVAAVSERILDPYVKHRASIADYIASLAVSLLSKVVQEDPYVRSGMWAINDFSPPLRRGLPFVRIGIAGAPEVSETVSTRCTAFGMEVAVFAADHRSHKLPVFSSLEELAMWADLLVIASKFRGGPAILLSRHLVQHLGRDGALILLSGTTQRDVEVVQEMLEDGSIAGAALCVERSNLFLDHPIFSMHNLILSPRSAIHSQQSLGAIEGDICARLAPEPREQGPKTP
ncbi:hypothetical protein PZN02_005954 (plasmid) [Sinorhizobium garamanticum]|uniref:D-isomer specific 2-hydroxyacid dehydrogenase NAD-binding domain-containing protein n=1 Tax=Sinorhizobium garamanticum TaxID=680247 RepID=A0ABY8DRY1_9HYPH|nr:NAD(P)-dependent oxidoreductase [Sinorhizobium garamanticum]WEX91663.1 hypothetical protein PZN02_005954 [Sinorhizobium garamanticum]